MSEEKTNYDYWIEWHIGNMKQPKDNNEKEN
jgi:hypothetical protein